MESLLTAADVAFKAGDFEHAETLYGKVIPSELSDAEVQKNLTVYIRINV